METSMPLDQRAMLADVEATLPDLLFQNPGTRVPVGTPVDLYWAGQCWRGKCVRECGDDMIDIQIVHENQPIQVWDVPRTSVGCSFGYLPLWSR